MSDPLIHWSIGRVECSIPFTRSTSPPFSLNSLARDRGVGILNLTKDSISNLPFILQLSMLRRR